ncbi:MAG: serine hydrolase [Woeseia sp.]
MKFHRTVCITLFLVFSQAAAHAAVSAEESFAEKVLQGMTLWQVPGMAVAVIENGETVFQQGFGAVTPGGANVDIHTLFANASTTKAMVVAGLLMLADEERLTLDDPVIRHLPELHFHPGIHSGAVTIRDLLAHRTGLPGTDDWTFHQRFPLAEQIRRMPTVAPEAGPRERLIYQNTMYELAGLIIERVSGKPWHEFLKERLWQPLGMQETYGRRGDIPRAKKHVLAHSLRSDKVQSVPFDLLAEDADAAGSAWSSIHDMTLWASFLLNGGVTASGGRLVSEAGMAQMFEPQQLSNEDDFYPTVALTKPQWRTYALGWFQQDFAGRRIDFHTGSLDGLTAIIGLDRAAKRAVVVMQNMGRAELRHALLWETMDRSPADERRDWLREVFDLYTARTAEGDAEWQAIAEGRLVNTRPSLPLTDYLGKYTNDYFGEIEFAAESAGSNAGVPVPARPEHRGPVLRGGMYEYEASHWHLDTFLVDYQNWRHGTFAEFQIGPDGKIATLTVFGHVFEKLD